LEPSVTGTEVEGIATELLAFLRPFYDAQFNGVPPQRLPSMGFYVGGYCSGESLPDEYEFVIPYSPTPVRVRERSQFGASWRGIDRPFSRLFQGFDPNIVNFLIQNGVPRGTVDEMFDPAKWFMQVLFDGMPAQDAVNFAEFVLKTTIGVSEFETGNPLCGGPLQVLFISADNKIGWISQPKLSLRG